MILRRSQDNAANIQKKRNILDHVLKVVSKRRVAWLVMGNQATGGGWPGMGYFFHFAH